MSDRLYTRFDSAFFEKTRLSMMTILYKEGTVSFNRFKTLLRGSDGGVYAHLRTLQQAGYVTRRKRLAADREGPGPSVQSQYSLTATGRRTFRDYLQFLEQTLHAHNSGEADGNA